MTMVTCSPKISAQTKRSIRNYWKALYTAKITPIRNYWKGLYTAKVITLSPKISLQTEKSAMNYWKARLDIANVKAYVKDHEAWVLILLIIFMVAGAVFYVGYQSRLDAGSGNPKTAHLENSLENGLRGARV
jgi:hypothetical protein